MAMHATQDDVGWGDAAWISSIAIALVIVAVGITFFVILIFTSLRCAYANTNTFTI
jgi:hypothetical protein